MNTLAASFFQIIINVALLLLFIRFFLQFADIRRHDPFAMPAYKTTRFVDTFSSIFPDLGGGRICTAAIALIFLVKLIQLWGFAMLTGNSLTPLALIFLASLGVAMLFLKVCFYLVFGTVILSWVIMLTQSMHPLIGMVMQMAEPIIAPFRRISPNLGMIDISPIFAFFALMLAQEALALLQEKFLPMF